MSSVAHGVRKKPLTKRIPRGLTVGAYLTLVVVNALLRELQMFYLVYHIIHYTK